jgi:arylformamidase
VLIDVSMDLHDDMLIYPGDGEFQRTSLCVADGRDPGRYSLSQISMRSHCGTHLDAPAHFAPGGLTIEQIPLDLLCGCARLLDCTRMGRAIVQDHLERIDLRGVRRLLLKTSTTSWLRPPFDPSYSHLTQDGALYLRQHTDVRLVGIDTLSIEGPDDPAYPVHHQLLCQDPPILVLEGLELAAVEPGDYGLWCLPLKLRGSDGAPARVVLSAE